MNVVKLPVVHQTTSVAFPWV